MNLLLTQMYVELNTSLQSIGQKQLQGEAKKT